MAPNPTRFRPTVAVVDLDAIRSNVRELKPEDVELMAVVKANAYGHGTVPV
ncbi:MAG: alanine racemase, partial [Actinobacteria bacterium]|nr:alanine racemase [Actinomycetota bacterium]